MFKNIKEWKCYAKAPSKLYFNEKYNLEEVILISFWDLI